MNITDEQIFQAKKQLQEDITKFEQDLQKLIKKQQGISNVETLAATVLQYNQIEREIEDRAHVFTLLAAPPSSLTSPFVKSEFFSYIVAAETIGPEMVNLLTDDFITQIRKELQSGEYDSVDLVHAEFKEYILPGKIIGEKFEEIDSLLNEMNVYCKNIKADYNEAEGAQQVLKYAFEISITADTRMEPTIEAIRKFPLQNLSDQDRAELLDKVEEHLAVIRYNEAKKQNIAMDKAVKMLEQKQQPKEQ